MIFHENRLPADDSHEIYLIFLRKLEKMSQYLPSAADVIGALRVGIVLIFYRVVGEIRMRTGKFQMRRL